MSENIQIPKSLVEQTLDEMLSIIEKQSEFDTTTIDNLKALVKNGEIKKAPHVVKAMKSVLTP